MPPRVDPRRQCSNGNRASDCPREAMRTPFAIREADTGRVFYTYVCAKCAAALKLGGA